MITVFFIGVIAAATMIIPGVSGSLVLMILGYYFGIITAVKDFISALKDLDFAAMVNQGLILAPFAIGCLIGIFFIAKLINWLLSRYASATFCGILGLIIASPISIFYKVQQEYDMSGTGILQVIIGIVFFAACMGLTLYMGHMDSQNEA
jgi:putative membrane protein